MISGWVPLVPQIPPKTRGHVPDLLAAFEAIFTAAAVSAGSRAPDQSDLSAETNALAVTTPDLDAFDERAAIAEHEGGLTREAAERLAASEQGFAHAADLRAAAVAGWATALAHIADSTTDPMGRACIEAALAFIRAGWAETALAAGWTEVELIGLDPTTPWEHVNRMGAAYVLSTPTDVTAKAIVYAGPATRPSCLPRGLQAPGAIVPWFARPKYG